MLRPTGRSIPFLGLVLIPTACSTMQSTNDIQTAKMNEMKSAYGEHFTYMIDNAILRDMSIADGHFIRHTSELSGVGTARLERLARMLNTYGGTVRYDTALDDEPLVAQRIEHVREFLVLSGCDLERVEFAVMGPGGRGLPGREAVEKHLRSMSSEQEAALDGSLSGFTGDN